MAAVGRIYAFLDHKFDFSKMASAGPNEICVGGCASVVCKDVCLKFQLSVVPKETQNNAPSRIRIMVSYIDGPSDRITLEYLLFVQRKNDEPLNVAHFKEHTLSKRMGSGSSFAPGTVEALAQKGYLINGSVLHVTAVFIIPEAAFQNPRNKYSAPAHNEFARCQFGQINSPAETNSVLSNRFKLTSKDGHDFFVHKDVLSFASDRFKQMFDSNKPALFDFLKEGFMSMENLNGCAMMEMLSFIYLQHSTPRFEQFVQEVVPAADMYGLTGLMMLCQEAWVQQVAKERQELDTASLLSLSAEAWTLNFNRLKRLCEDELVRRVHGIATVRYVDFGPTNRVSLSELYELSADQPAPVRQLHALSIPCRLSGVRAIGDHWSAEAIQAFKELCDGKNHQLHCKFGGRQGGICSVELFVTEERKSFAQQFIQLFVAAEKKSVAQQLMETGHARINRQTQTEAIGTEPQSPAVAFGEFPLPTGTVAVERVDGNSTTPDSFALRVITEHYTELYTMLEQSIHPGTGKIKDVQVGSIGVAKFEQRWLRCEVIEVEGDMTWDEIRGMMVHARKYQMSRVTEACAHWLAVNWNGLIETSQVTLRINGQSDHVFTELLGMLVKKTLEC